MLSFYDAAFPPVNPPKTDGVAFYIGGDTPHVWTQAEIGMQKARYRLPIYVRNIPPWNASADAQVILARLKAIGAPKGSTVVIDLETVVQVAYVAALNAAIRQGGYHLMKYGSSGNINSNPPTDGGTWVAIPEAKPATLPTGTVGVQYADPGPYDLSEFSGLLALWDTQPPPVILPPIPAVKGVKMIILFILQGSVPSGTDWPGIFTWDGSTAPKHILNMPDYLALAKVLPVVQVSYDFFAEINV
jgi:hypothetical protein